MWRQWERIIALHCTCVLLSKLCGMQTGMNLVVRLLQCVHLNLLVGIMCPSYTVSVERPATDMRGCWFIAFLSLTVDCPPHTQYACTACAHALSSVVPSVRNVVIVDKSLYSEWYLSIQCTGQLCWAFYKCRVC